MNALNTMAGKAKHLHPVDAVKHLPVETTIKTAGTSLGRFLPARVTRSVARQALHVQANSPKLLFVVGVVGFGATIATTIHSTFKAEEVLEGHRKQSAQFQEARSVAPEAYSEKDLQSDMLKLYVQTAYKFTKLYGPSIVCGAISLGAFTGAHNILVQRNTAVTAAYMSVSKALKTYRERVSNEVGEDKERELFYDAQTVTVVEDTPNGPKKVKKTIAGAKAGYSPYAKFFSQDTSDRFRMNPDYNKSFLYANQNWANDQLKARGHVFLNEVYQMLGLEETPEGQFVGWFWNNEVGDGFIDFGLWKDNEAAENFFAGLEGGMWLDFNVQGPVFEMLRNKNKRD